MWKTVQCGPVLSTSQVKTFFFFTFVTAFTLLFCIFPDFYSVRQISNDFEIANPKLRSAVLGPPITIQCGSGELGNRMFFYAVVYGLSRLNNRSGFIQQCNTITCRYNDGNCEKTPLHETFKLSLSVRPNIPGHEQRRHEINFHIKFPEDYNIPVNANVIAGEPWPNSVTHFIHVREEIRKEFTFVDKFRQKADEVLSKARGKNLNTILVGIHVRRNDYLKHLQRGKKPLAPVSFYEYGMKYYRKKYGKVVFVLTSDDHVWCRKNLRRSDIFFTSDFSSPAEDLAILSHCNHTLFDYGTYGLWGAFLAGGEVMYYVDGITDPVYEDMNAKLMYPTDWTGISSAMLDAMT